MKIFFLIFFSLTLMNAQTSDPLREKIVRNISTICDTSNAIVGVALKDLNTDNEILIRENEVFPQASTIKIHILSEIYRQAAAGKFSLNDIHSLPASDRVGGSGILNMLGEHSVSMSVRDYAVLMMNVSDNSATNFLIDLVGMKNVNESLQKNGAVQTKLQRVMMDYQAAKEGRENISTPRDVMMILEKLYNGTLVSKDACADMLSIMKLEKDGWLKEGIAPEIPIANKAGDVEGVRVDAGIIFLENSPYILCVMTKLLLHDDEGEKIISAVSREAFNYFERKANSNQFGRRIPK
ncbi:MAG: serine hydrolase [Bacteroidota bacterium]